MTPIKRFAVAPVLALVVTIAFAIPSPAQDEEALKKDLTAVIALHGLPCGQVVAVKVLADKDYAASCKHGNKHGNKYRVYLNAAGREAAVNAPVSTQRRA